MQTKRALLPLLSSPKPLRQDKQVKQGRHYRKQNHGNKWKKTTFMQGKVASESCNERWKGVDDVSDYELSLLSPSFFLTQLLLRFYEPLFFFWFSTSPPSAQFQKLSRPSFSPPITSHFPNLALRAGKRYLCVFFAGPWNIEPLCLPSLLSSFPPQKINRPIPFHSPSFFPFSHLSFPRSIVYPQNPDRIEFGYRYPCPDPATVSRCFSLPLGPLVTLLSFSLWIFLPLSLSPFCSFVPSFIAHLIHSHFDFSFSTYFINSLTALFFFSLSLSSRPSGLDCFPSRVFRKQLSI